MSPAYASGPFAGNVAALEPGIIGYSFGSFNDQAPPSKMQVTNVTGDGTTATLAVTILEGDAPLVGSLISTQGLTHTGFNVTAQPITAVSFTGATGTIQFLNATTQASAADAGLAVVPQPVVGEAIATGNKGKQFAIQSFSGGNKQHGLSWFTEISGGPSAVQIDLQGADRDVDADYTTFDTSVAIAGESRSIGNINYLFYRVKATTITGGTSPKLVSGIIPS
jgi:hypothetical protein